MSEKFDSNRFGDELDRLFEQSQYSKHEGGDGLEELAALGSGEENVRPAEAPEDADAETMRGFWSLFAENQIHGRGVPSREAAVEKAKVVQRAEAAHQPPSALETDEYLAAWQAFRASALSIAKVLKPCGGAALRYALEIETEASQTEGAKDAPHIRSRSDALPLSAYAGRVRRMYEGWQSQIDEEEALGHVLIVLGLGVEACARLETALKRIAGLPTKEQCD